MVELVGVDVVVGGNIVVVVTIGEVNDVGATDSVVDVVVSGGELDVHAAATRTHALTRIIAALKR